MTWTDEELVARSIRGDADSFNQLILRWERPIFALAYRTIGREEDARDVCQETFLRAYKNLRSFRGEARFSTWLYRIAYNCFREEARKRKELVGIDEAQLEAEHDPQTIDPGLRYDLAQALQLLPVHERTAIVLCCQNGLSHDEAARVLEIPLGTVKTNVLRGREKLKRALAAWGPN